MRQPGLWNRSFLYIKPEPNFWLGTDIPDRGGRLGQSKGGLLESLCQRPADVTVQANPTRRKNTLNTVKNGNL